MSAGVQTSARVLAARMRPSYAQLHHAPRILVAYRVNPTCLRGAERRETRELAKLPGTAGEAVPARWRRAALPCDRECAPPGALLAALFNPGHAFAMRVAPHGQPSSWRGDRSIPRVEPRAARVRHACRPRVPHPVPPSRCPRKAPLSEQGDCANNPSYLQCQGINTTDHAEISERGMARRII
jgi:hypothetical protein